MAPPDTETSVPAWSPGSREIFHLRFAHHYVTVASAAPDVSSEFRSSVALMLDTHPVGSCAGTLSVEVVKTPSWWSGPDGVEAYPCRRSGAAADHLFHVAIKLLMTARSDLLWLHGGVAERQGRATMLCGRSGAGKSTLVAELLAAGMELLFGRVRRRRSTPARQSFRSPSHRPCGLATGEFSVRTNKSRRCPRSSSRRPSGSSARPRFPSTGCSSCRTIRLRRLSRWRSARLPKAYSRC